MYSLRRALCLMLALLSPLAFAASSRSVEGLVTHVEPARSFVVVRHDDTGRHHIYFHNAGSRITAGGEAVDLAGLVRGHRVALEFRDTDRGRDIRTLVVDAPARMEDVPAVDLAGSQRTIAGEVTGLRNDRRTLTVLDDVTRERRTILVPEATPISRDGRALRLADLEPGLLVSLRFQMTDAGPVLSTASAPAPVVEQRLAAVAAPQLPKTAGNAFTYLYSALALFALAGVAGAIGTLRRAATRS